MTISRDGETHRDEVLAFLLENARHPVCEGCIASELRLALFDVICTVTSLEHRADVVVKVGIGDCGRCGNVDRVVRIA